MEFDKLLKNEDFDFKGAIGEALDALYSPTGRHPMGMHEDSCLVISVIVQWLVRYLVKRLMQLLTPEALLINAQCIPQSFLKMYFELHEHFNLKNIISNQLENLKRNNG